MGPQDSPRFIQALNAMGLMFSDELTKPRQLLYWDVFRERVTIEEWEYACGEAMSQMDFHKLPLPAVLLRYVATWREEQSTRLKHEAKLRAHAERLALEASAEWQADQAKLQAEAVQREQEHRAWIEKQPRSVLIELGVINPPHPGRWQHLSADELDYSQETDPEQAKARLRRQLRQLMEGEYDSKPPLN